MHARRTGLDHGLHQLERIEHAAKTGLSVRHDGCVVVDITLVAGINAFGVLNFVGTLKGVVDAFNDGRHRVHGVQGLIRVHRRVRIVVGSHLPARQVNRLHAGFDLLHGLAAGERAQTVDIRLRVQQIPELLGAATRQRVLNPERTAQAHHIGRAVAPLDALPAGIGGPVFFQCGNLLFATQLFGHCLGHGITPKVD